MRAVALLVSLLLVNALGLSVTSAPAAATSTLLCTGYAGCAKLGMSNDGYKSASGTMYWRMYTGHNCTNYAAYRMVRSGLPNVRPWSGDGNASNWGPANPSLTDQAPAVGAVAWWGANVRPAGSAGHVAYVEQVLSNDEIVVSQDSWGGDFSWARITRAGGSWPSGFIHFDDVTLQNTAKPVLAGTPKVGEVLTSTAGSWSQPDVSVAYQWRADGTPIPGATGPSLTLGLAQQDQQIAVRVTATKLGFPSARAFSARTSAVAPGVISSTAAPTLTGDPTVDVQLTASAGEWYPTPDAVGYQWTADGVPVAGATAATLTPDASLVGKTLAVTVTASKQGYADVPVTSAATAPVAPGTFTVTDPAAVTVPETDARFPRPGQTLSLDPADYTPQDADVSVQWLRAGAPIEGGTGSTYQLGAADLGRHVTAQVTLTKPGYTPLTTRAPGTRWVKSTPTLRVRTRPHRGRVRVVVRVTAFGIDAVPGTVRIRSHGIRQDLTLDAGRVAFTFRGLHRGRRTFKVRYLPSRTVLGTGLRRTVRVR